MVRVLAGKYVFDFIFIYFFAHENMKKLPSKVAQNRPKLFFSVLQTSPKPAQITFSGPTKVSLRDFYVMTLCSPLVFMKVEFRIFTNFLTNLDVLKTYCD